MAWKEYEYLFEVVSKQGKRIHVITVYTTNKIKRGEVLWRKS